MEPFIGQIQCVGFNFAPVGWFLCEGQLLPIASYTALFSLLGTTYGGDGRTTFALPDFRGRVSIAPGTGPGLPSYSWGQRSGSPTNNISVANLPAHSHTGTLNVSSANADTATPASGQTIAAPGTQAGRAFSPTLGFNSGTPNIALNSIQTNNTGSGVAINNMQPYLAVYHIIAWSGIFPSRS